MEDEDVGTDPGLIEVQCDLTLPPDLTTRKEAAELHCVIHPEGYITTDKLKELPDHLFEKLQDIVRARKGMKSTKYRRIINNFPETPGKHGYHTSCYKNFTALSKSKKELVTGSPTTATPTAAAAPIGIKGLRSTSSAIRSNRGTSVLEKKCIFCKKAVITLKRKKQPLVMCATSNFEKSIREECTALRDTEILASVGETDFTAAEVHYHSICRARFSASAASNARKLGPRLEEDKIWKQKRHSHHIAFTFLVEHLTDFVLGKGEMTTISILHDVYLDVLAANGNDQAANTFLPHHLLNKIAKRFGQQLKYEGFEKDTIILKNGIDVSEAAKIHFMVKMKSSPDQAIRKIAFALRKAILALKKKDLEFLTVNELLTDDNESPDEVTIFINALFHGPTFKLSQKKITPRMKALAADMLFSVSRGNFVPAKHLALGLGMKSMTGKKEVVRILNKFGYSINYWLAEELETQIAEAITTKKTATPEGIHAEPGLTTCTAFDNYDEETETLSGKGTLHETVGICFQRNPLEPLDPQPGPSIAVKAQKRRRKFHFTDSDLEPYSKKLRLLGGTWTERVMEEPTSYKDAERRDIFFAFSHFVFENELPMWIGYNSRTVRDENEVQNVVYLRNYEETSTSQPMVLETLKVTQAIAQECGQEFGIVTYDLAIAKPAEQIKSMESPRFKNVFVHFGAFHLFMAFFAALGKVVSEAGLTHILSESEVLASNSRRGFISGKFFNRCKRLHPLFALALQLEHIDFFCSSSKIDFPAGFEIFLHNVFQHDQFFEDNEYPNEIQEFLRNYGDFCNDTRQGVHGLTAQFWQSYIDYVSLYQKMSRAVRLNDVDLFTFCLPKMTDLFFITNHHNYARWMVEYHANLQNLDSSHPGLKGILQKGGLSVKRTKIPFSGTPIDQTLEQTVNRDAASRLTGISAMTNASAARRRWSITRSTRSEVVTALKEMAGAIETDDVCMELQKSRILRDNADLNAVRFVIKNSANPFDPRLEKNRLYNIGTGKAASTPVKEYLLTTMSKGEELRNEFVEGCRQNSERFNLPIKRQVINNFDKDEVKMKVTTKTNQIKELGITCGIFGRLTCLAVERKIKIEEVLLYSLTPLPLALVHIDGTMMKTEKSQLLKAVEKLLPQNSSDAMPHHCAAEVIDAMFFLHTLPQYLPETYGELSTFILKKICSSEAKRVDVVFDKYINPSIKDSERERRLELTDRFAIQGAHQKIPKDFQKALLSENFKTELLKFLTKDWKLSNFHWTKGKRIFFNDGDKTFCNDGGELSAVPELECQHEEADTRLFFHLSHILKEAGRETKSTINLKIRTGDTDVVVILIYNLAKSEALKPQHQVWCDFGAGKPRRAVNITQMIKKLGSSVSEAITGFHAFTGTDYTAAFKRKGKVRPFNLMLKSDEYQKAFASLGTSKKVVASTSKTLEKFTCEMYGLGKKCTSVNEGRVQLFSKWAQPRNATKPFAAIKNIDSSLMPPNSSAFECKLARCNFVSAMWNKAALPNPLDGMLPEEHGWEMFEGKLKPKWDTKSPLPANLMSGHDDDSSSDENDFNTDSEIESDLSESDFD